MIILTANDDTQLPLIFLFDNNQAQTITGRMADINHNFLVAETKNCFITNQPTTLIGIFFFVPASIRTGIFSIDTLRSSGEYLSFHWRQSNSNIHVYAEFDQLCN